MLRSMSSSPTGWWRRGCFSSIGAGLNNEQTNIMSQPQAVYHLRWLKSMRGFQSSGVVTHLSKTSRLRASFVRVGVLSVFWRNSTFFFRLCRHTHTRRIHNHAVLCYWKQKHIWWIRLTEISLSALARSFCKDFISSLVLLTSTEALWNWKDT